MTMKLKILNLNNLIRRYQSGASLKHLSDTTGIGRGPLARQFLEYGLILRGRSDAEYLKWHAIKQSRHLIVRQMHGAWTARRGSQDSLQIQCSRAITRAAHLTHRGFHEDRFATMLRRSGLLIIQQAASERYNIDLAVDPGRIAVEIITSQPSSCRAALYRQRLYDLLDRNWCVLLIDLYHLRYLPIAFTRICHQIITVTQLAGRHKALRGQYGVIGRDGQPLTRARHDLPGRTNIFAGQASDN